MKHYTQKVIGILNHASPDLENSNLTPRQIYRLCVVLMCIYSAKLLTQTCFQQIIDAVLKSSITY
jgi:hypothetical protein